eukprot:15349811-Ditylum_brightwellii.AAC.1
MVACQLVTLDKCTGIQYMDIRDIFYRLVYDALVERPEAKIVAEGKGRGGEGKGWRRGRPWGGGEG